MSGLAPFCFLGNGVSFGTAQSQTGQVEKGLRSGNVGWTWSHE